MNNPKPIRWRKKLRRRLYLLAGGIRHFFRHCPNCNDDAPELYDCTVCEQWAHTHRFPSQSSGSEEYGWPAPEKLRRKWWARFKYRVESGTFD